MDTDFEKTKYFQYLLKRAQNFQVEMDSFVDEFHFLWNQQIDEVGIILKAHLVIENYLDRYLAIAYPTITEWEKIRLTFSQKILLSNTDGTVLALHHAAIKELNTIRNKFAHRVSYKIQESDYPEIRRVITAWNKALNKPLPEGLGWIRDFVVHCCSHMQLLINGVRDEAQHLGLPVYMKWLKEMQQQID